MLVPNKCHSSQDLVTDLKKELGGHFEDVVLALFYPRYERDARFLHHAIKGLGTDEQVSLISKDIRNSVVDAGPL